MKFLEIVMKKCTFLYLLLCANREGLVNEILIVLRNLSEIDISGGMLNFVLQCTHCFLRSKKNH